MQKTAYPTEVDVQDEEYLTPTNLTERYKKSITLRTLANWRSIGEGPQYTKIGGRVLYALSAVLKWESKRRIGPALVATFAIRLAGRAYFHHAFPIVIDFIT